MENLRISVIIPVYNGEKYIGRAIDSVLMQTLEPFEIIVIDDGSVDGTGSILSSYGNKIDVYKQENQGVCKARNAGLQRARGNWIAQLDADDWWDINKLNVMANVLSCREPPSLVFCAQQFWYEDGKNVKKGRIQRRLHDVSCENIAHELMYRNVVVGGNSGPLIKISCLEDVGFFDVNLAGGEDWDLWIRIALRFRIQYVDTVLLNRLERSDSLSKNIEAMLWSDLRVLEKHKHSYLARGAGRWGIRKAKAAVLSRSGVEYFCRGDLGKARPVLIKALLLNPFNTQAIVPMIKFLLGMRHKSS